MISTERCKFTIKRLSLACNMLANCQLQCDMTLQPLLILIMMVHQPVRNQDGCHGSRSADLISECESPGNESLTEELG